MAVVYRAAATDGLIAVPLDAFTAVFHRASGITHLLTEPAPQILSAIGGGCTVDMLMDRLARDYDIDGAERPALMARLDELVAAGLVAAA